MDTSHSGEEIFIHESDLSEYIGERFNPQCVYILVCLHGYAVFSFNQKKRAVSAGNLLAISSDLITTVHGISRTCRAGIVIIPNEIAQEATLSLNPDLASALYYDPVIRPDREQFENIYQWFRQLRWSLQQVHPNRAGQLLKNSIQSLLLVLENIYPYEKYTEFKGLSSQNRIFCRFCSMICEMCRKEHGVQYYADSLAITPYYLSRITGSIANMTPKQMIDEQTIAEIKHVLVNSELTINEIAELFNYGSTSYFCKFFKRGTGKSPSAYRKLLG